jgi:hypothetical protein
MLTARRRRAWGAALLGGLGSLVGLVAAWLGRPDEPRPFLLVLVAGSCLLGLLGAQLAWSGRRVASLLLLEATLGLGVGIGEAALIPGALLLLGALLALLGR